MNKQEKQTNKKQQKQRIAWWLLQGKGGEGAMVKGKGGQIYGDRRFDTQW